MVKIVGTFRSGTNLMRLLVERHLGLNALFNLGWWKHALAPTGFDETGHYCPGFPVIVMIKEPVSQTLSWYRFFGRRRPELLAGRTFSEFLRSEFIVHDSSYDGRGPRYLFPTPIDYWNAFHFSYLSWAALANLVIYVRIEELKRNPGNVMAVVGRRLGHTIDRPLDVVLPAHEVLPGADGAPVRLGQLHAAPLPECGAADIQFIEARVSAPVRQMLDRLAI